MIPRRRDASCRGFSLAELMTVMALIALIGGLGAGAFHYARRNYSLTATAGRIQGAVRAARNSALTSGGPSFAVVDPVRRTVSSYLFEPIDEWGFDGAPVGALVASRTRLQGGSAVTGKIGQAMDFSGGGYVDCGNAARYQLLASILAEAWVHHSLHDSLRPRRLLESEQQRSMGRRIGPLGRRGSRSRSSPRPIPKVSEQSDGAAGAIVSKPGSWFFGMTRRGHLEAAIGGFRVRTLEPVVPAGQWVHVGLRYDGRELELTTDGVPRAWRVTETPLGSGGDKTISSARDKTRRDRKKKDKDKDKAPDLRKLLPKTAPLTSSPLTISAPDAPFPGVLDEVLLYGSVEPFDEPWEEFEKIIGWKKVLRFDRRGHLDSRFHPDPVRLLLIELPDEIKKTTSTTVATDHSVTFAEWLARWDNPPADLTEASEEAKILRRYGDVRTIAITIDRLGTVSSEELR